MKNIFREIGNKKEVDEVERDQKEEEEKRAIAVVEQTSHAPFYNYFPNDEINNFNDFDEVMISFILYFLEITKRNYLIYQFHHQEIKLTIFQ